MHLMALPDFVRESAPYAKLLASLQAEQSVASWQVVRAARPYVLAAIARDWQAPIVYITGRGKRAYNVAEQLPVWLGEAQSERILRYAEPTPMFYDHLPWDREVINERIGVLDALSHYEAGTPAPVIIASARALMQTTLAPRQFRQASFSISVGDIITPDTMLKRWLSMGYEASPMVTETGQFSRRGGILDVFPMASRHPIRIEFFGDEVETLRTFSPSTQRTVENVQTIRIVPAREALPQDLPRATKHLETFFASHSDDEVNTWQQDMEALANGQAFPYLEYYLPYAQPNPVSLLDYVTDDTLIIVEDYDDFMNVVQTLTDDAIANRENNFKTQQLPEDYPMPYVSASLLAQDLERQRRLFLTLQADVHVDNDESPRIFKPGGRWGGQLRPFLADVRKLTQAGDRAIIVSQQVERLTQLWQDEDVSEFVPRVKQVGDMPDVGSLRFVEGSLGEGWTLTHDEGTLHIFTDAEIFNWSRPEPRRRKKTNTQQRRQSPEADYADWKEGNYVVHVDFGIGEFKGLKTRTVEGNEREYLLVEYAGTDTLFVPIHQADRLTRYVGADERPPKLNKLGKPIEWVRTREKARKAAEEEAHELLEIYARRANSSGFGYQPDTPWQRELEASFPYVETDDQLRALREVKGDMQQTMPMDRLVCGDVGYGKTEVALRAAFKAVMDGKQVAILVPTTVLADQHYRTFSRRMAPFPLKVELLSRFRTKAQQAKAVDLLAEGKIDIIIGTHRLLSQDVAFKNLGLVIIDEEQRFGVKHKEHFKKFRASVDVLTLTATPIPRTLYMSLSGVRDISMIQTPPEERLSVITHVGGFDAKLARQAILRELDRGGQVFIIHNRVRTIETVREKFEEIVPEASIIIGHGQMSGRELEGVISDFSAGNYDVLLATSIIENGIDMPNVNTLIVDRADWFGMSQLYQIRGRVGRGAQQAYAYFFHAGGKMTEEAKARLETLAEHTDLGAGFQIAVRDLEIRGAGDILSTKQTGHVAQVGLQLYSQLLQQAVKRQKGDADDGASDEGTGIKERVIIDLPLPAYLPNDWIPEMALRLQLYRRMSALTTLEDVNAISQEMRDRFGRLPRAVEGLLYQIQVKLLASAINATAVIKPRQHILVKLPWLTAIDRDELAERLSEDVEVSRTAVEFNVTSLQEDDTVWRLRLLEILEILQEGVPQTLTEDEVNTMEGLQ